MTTLSFQPALAFEITDEMRERWQQIIRKAMEDKTQREVAYAAGVSQPVVTELLHGPQRRGSFIETVRVAENLGLDLYDLAHAIGLYEDVAPLEIKPDRIAIAHDLNKVPANKLILIKAIIHSYIKE